LYKIEARERSNNFCRGVYFVVSIFDYVLFLIVMVLFVVLDGAVSVADNTITNQNSRSDIKSVGLDIYKINGLLFDDKLFN